MFGNDHYPIKLGLNKNVPFRSYNDDNENGFNLHDVNVVYINKPKVELEVIAEYYANHFINVQVNKEKESHK
jgi:hypothetical protein